MVNTVDRVDEHHLSIVAYSPNNSLRACEYSHT